MKKSLLALALVSATAAANEGMWMPQQLNEIAGDLKATGLELDPALLTKLTEHPMGAIVSLGGCSASFVSPQGLVVTNHHCAYGSIQYNSTAEKNLIKDGFLAKTLGEELPAAPGSRVYVTVDVQNVSEAVIDAETAKLGGKARFDAIEDKEKRLVAECEKDVGHRCNVYSYYGGQQYYLIKQMEIRDVRLVHAPAEGVGKFGGDTDNWMWPRHTGDYSYYRAYVGKDGKPADFAKDNVPYQPKHHLRLAKQGVKEGDFVMVTGYPGRTNRHRLPSEVQFTFDWHYPAFVKASGETLDIIARETKTRPEAAIKYASTVASINNYYKNRQGMLDSYKEGDLLARKSAELDALKAWVKASPERKARYGKDIARAEKLIAERDAITRQEFLLDYATPRLLKAAGTLLRLAHESAKPDMAREQGYQARDLPRIQQSLTAIDKRYDAAVDKAISLHFLKQYLALPKNQRNGAFLKALELKPGMDEAAIAAALDKLYAGSQLGEQKARLAWIGKDVAAFEASSDRFVRAAVALFDDTMAREERDEELAGKVQQAYASYMKALIDHKHSLGQAVFPDANSTLRVTYGKVAGRAKGGADGTSWSAFTTLNGILPKHTGEGEFDAPDAQVAAIKAKQFDPYYEPSLNSVPVNFLATLDITGGNSGSAALNARGELVGLAFDGTLDSIISDWDFDTAKTRSIQVDLRYMLWQMKVVDKADNLLKEMGAL